MGKISNFRRLKSDDFPEEFQEAIGILSEYYNFFGNEVTGALNGDITIENLDRSMVTIEMTVGDNGVPIGNSKFGSSSGFSGSTVKNIVNLTNPSALLPSAPFVDYISSGAGIYTIRKINGLIANNRYRIVLELSV